MAVDAQDKKAMIMTAVVVLAVVLGAGGFWLGWHHHSAGNVNDGVASLDGSASTSSNSSGLSVDSSSATDLGQLGAASQSGASGQSGGSSSSSGSSSPVDPSTFAQYNKYASNSTALFGDVQVGSGATLGSGQKATISYKGWLTDGTLFDQSSSFSFTLGASQVMPGMEEGASGMKIGGTRLIIIPPSLGYGAQGQGSIPANAVLVFEVNLLDAN